MSCVQGAAQRDQEAVEEGEEPNYEEKTQEIVQSILQEVVNTVVGGKSHSMDLKSDFCLRSVKSGFPKLGPEPSSTQLIQIIKT